MKIKKLVILSIFLSSLILFSSFSKRRIDFTEYEKFVESFYINQTNKSFDTIQNYLYDNNCLIRVDVKHNINDSCIYTNQIMVNQLFDFEEIQELNSFLFSLGNFSKAKLLSESVENIYDVPLSNLFCLEYKVKYDNYETNEQFWLKQRDGEVFIYRYTIYLTVYE